MLLAAVGERKGFRGMTIVTDDLGYFAIGIEGISISIIKRKG